MKKCTSFVKKLRSFSDAHADSLIKDIRTLRLTKYISEAVPAICEVTLKVADLHGAAMVCSHLHQRYKEFSNKDTGLVATLLKDFEDRGEGSADPAKRRSTLRFLNELYLVGIVHVSLVYLLGITVSVAVHVSVVVAVSVHVSRIYLLDITPSVVVHVSVHVAFGARVCV